LTQRHIDDIILSFNAVKYFDPVTLYDTLTNGFKRGDLYFTLPLASFKYNKECLTMEYPRIASTKDMDSDVLLFISASEILALEEFTTFLKTHEIYAKDEENFKLMQRIAAQIVNK